MVTNLAGVPINYKDLILSASNILWTLSDDERLFMFSKWSLDVKSLSDVISYCIWKNLCHIWVMVKAVVPLSAKSLGARQWPFSSTKLSGSVTLMSSSHEIPEWSEIIIFIALFIHIADPTKNLFWDSVLLLGLSLILKYFPLDTVARRWYINPSTLTSHCL